MSPCQHLVTISIHYNLKPRWKWKNILSGYNVYNTCQPFFFAREIQTEYKPRRRRWFVFPRTKQRVACLCRSCVETSPHSTHPCLTRPQNDMHFTARVHWCTQNLYNYMYCTRVLAQHWLSVTVHVVSVVPVGTCLGTRAILN